MTNNKYHRWLCDIVCRNRFSDSISYSQLLSYLSHREFTVIIPKDINRAKDGVDLRYRYQSITDEYVNYDEPCSILEMMVALAIRCEETIMDNPEYGDRTGQWFWSMIKNLGLYFMTDNRFDVERVDLIIDRFLNREYESNGKGGLFIINDCDCDLRNVEIWYQLCWYLDRFV